MKRATALLADKTTAEKLRYAALELRLCIEALTYEKLRSFSKVIPVSVLEMWQPPQAVKALLEFEPTGDKSFKIYVGIEEEYGKPAPTMHLAGEHNALSLKWLRKHYNKLGSLLHAPTNPQNASFALDKVQSYLTEVVADLQDPLSGDIVGGSMSEAVAFDCLQCKSVVVVNGQAVEASHKAVCLNPQCKAEYYATAVDGQIKFNLIATGFKCANQECQTETSIENRKLAIGMEFICSSCGLKHRFIHRKWLYVPEEHEQ